MCIGALVLLVGGAVAPGAHVRPWWCRCNHQWLEVVVDQNAGL